MLDLRRYHADVKRRDVQLCLIMNIHYRTTLAKHEGKTAMARQTKDATYRKLRTAVVAEAVEKGFAGTSVAGVVNRAQVSAGTVYVHFENKDAMLQRIYLDIKAEFHAAIMAAQDEADSAQRVRRMWTGMFDFVRQSPEAFLFLEFGSTAKILTPAQSVTTERYAQEIQSLLTRGIDDGTLAPLNVTLLALLLTAPAMQLARNHVQKGQKITIEIVDQTFERVWLSIANTAQKVEKE